MEPSPNPNPRSGDTTRPAETPGELISVAVVEDDPDIREAMSGIIDDGEGLEVVGAFESCGKASKQLPGLQPNVVLMDIHLPDGNGIQCVRRLKPAIPASEFMMLTVVDNDESVFNALRAGATGYLLKVEPPERILESIRLLLAGGSPMSASIARRVLKSFHQTPALTEEMKTLTPRELEILDWLSQGYTYKEIAARLYISLHTVRMHIHHIYEKLHVQGRYEAVKKLQGHP